jgi:hypothetical protein
MVLFSCIILILDAITIASRNLEMVSYFEVDRNEKKFL